MKSKLQNRINQAGHFIILGPCPFSMRSLKRSLASFQETSSLLIIYVDGGICHRSKIEKTLAKLAPSFSIGDNDSAKDVLDELKKEQLVSDLCYLLDWLVALGPKFRSIQFWGFLGKTPRYDHLLANFGEISRFHRAIASSNCTVTMEDKVHFLKKGAHSFVIRSAFSLMALRPVKVKISGKCTYPFEGRLQILSSRGLSNQGQGKVLISCSDQAFLLLVNKR